MSPPPLVEFEPLALGPFEISRLSWAGAAAAAGFLLGLAVARAELRRRGMPASLALDLFAAGAPVVLAASRAPALAEAFPRFLHDGSALASALAAPGSRLTGSLAAAGLAASFAWASRRPAAFLDAVAPSALIVAGAVAAGSASSARTALVLAAATLAAAGLGALAARRAGLRPGILAGLLGAACAALLLAPIPA